MTDHFNDTRQAAEACRALIAIAVGRAGITPAGCVSAFTGDIDDYKTCVSLAQVCEALWWEDPEMGETIRTFVKDVAPKLDLEIKRATRTALDAAVFDQSAAVRSLRRR